MKYPFALPFFDENEEFKRIKEVYDSNIFVHGEYSKLFEKSFKDFTGATSASSVSNCTAALHIAHHLASFDRKGFVACPAMSHIATANAIILSGNKPYFVDCNKYGNIDIELLESIIDETFVGITLVHFNGSPCDMDEIIRISKENNLYIIEDCALAVGSKYKGRHVGTFGDFGCFSFHPAKQLCTGEGGMVISAGDKQKKLDLIKAFGVDRSFSKRNRPGEYDVVDVGFNYRMPEMPAAMGISQMEKVELILNKREENFKEYLKSDHLLERHLPLADGASHYAFIFILDTQKQRQELQDTLVSNGIGNSIYYPKPIPEFNIYKELSYPSTDIKNASIIANKSLALPVGPHLENEDIEYIVNIIDSFLDNWE